MPKIVAPLSACSDRVRVQGQKTGATVKIYASLSNIFDEVFSGTAKWPDETYKLTRKLKAGETVYVDTFIENAEIVEPEPDQSELGEITVDGHLHACGRCGAFGNGYPGAEVRVISATRGPLGHGVIDPESGAAHVPFDPILDEGEALMAQQTICGISSTPSPCPMPDMPANTNRQLAAPIVRAPLHACERAIWIEGIADGALVRVFRDGQEASSACFPYSEAWYRLRRELDEGETITVDQRFPGCEMWSLPSDTVTVDVAQRPNAPALLGPFCKGTPRIGVGDLRHGATVTLIQTSEANPGTFLQAVQRGTVIADAEAWDTECDIPLADPLDLARGQYVFAYQTLCDLHSPASNRGKVHSLRGTAAAPAIVGPLIVCSRMIRVKGIKPGARIEVFMSCVAAPGFRRIASRYVFAKTADIPVAPALRINQEVFVRQHVCGQTSESQHVTVDAAPNFYGPTVEECGNHLHVKGAQPGALVEVYKDGFFFRSGRSGSGTVTFSLPSPLPAGTRLKARQILCHNISAFGAELVVRDDIAKRHLQIIPVGAPGHPDFSTERVCQLTGAHDPEQKPIRNDCQEAGIVGTDLGIVIDHTTGDGKLYFFFGDTRIEDRVEEFVENWDCMARTDATEAGELGPKLNFLHDFDDGDPVLRAFQIPDIPQMTFEVPTGGFSHAGKLYVFASTECFQDNPRTIGLGKDTNFMGRSLLVSASNWRDMFQIVPGHENISNRWDEADGTFKFINIAPWKIRNKDLSHLPDNAATSEEGLLMIGCGRYRESQPCLAYVPLPEGRDPDFNEWRFLAGYGDRGEGTGPCGKPKWSKFQKDALFLWDDRNFFPAFEPPVPPSTTPTFRIVPENRGVMGELSMAFLPSVGLFVVLYAGTKLRSAEFPWGPWSPPIELYSFGRDHANWNDSSDPRPRYAPNGGTYGPYIVPRFTEHDPVTGETILYHALSFTDPLYQVELMRTRVRLECGYREDAVCGERPSG
jgi:hypothetical protein